MGVSNGLLIQGDFKIYMSGDNTMDPQILTSKKKIARHL